MVWTIAVAIIFWLIGFITALAWAGDQPIRPERDGDRPVRYTTQRPTPPVREEQQIPDRRYREGLRKR